MDRSNKRPPVSYPVARVFTVVLTAFIWSGLLAVVGFVFSGLVGREQIVSAIAAAYILSAALFFVPLFSAQGVLVGLCEGLAKGDFNLPAEPTGADGADHAARSMAPAVKNPWSLGLFWMAGLGIPASLLAYLAVTRLLPLGLPRANFVLLLAGCGALLATITSFVVSGKVFLQQASVPRPNRLWAGSRSRYLWTRHALPNGLVNAVINALVAFVVFPQPALDPGNLLKREIFVGDNLVTLFILTAAVLTGARAHARSDLRWGVLSVEDGRVAPGISGQVFRLLGFSCAATAALFALLSATGIESVSLTAFVVWRAVVFGLYPALVAYLAAYWVLASPALLLASPSASDRDE